MVISGLQNTTLLDYPGHVAATVFLGGCNYRCPFCHNADIVLDPSENISQNELMAFLTKRSGILDGVCITGGEPTIHRDLLSLLSDIKALGLLVKLDTNGTNPAMLRQAVDQGLVDYIAMDVKSSLRGYGQAVGIEDYDTTGIEESIQFIMECGVDYEFRTTLVKGIHTYDDMCDIVNLISGARAYYLQSYKDNDSTIEKTAVFIDNRVHTLNCSEFSKEELLEFLDIARNKVKSAKLRGIDIYYS